MLTIKVIDAHEEINPVIVGKMMRDIVCALLRLLIDIFGSSGLWFLLFLCSGMVVCSLFNVDLKNVQCMFECTIHSMNE